MKYVLNRKALICSAKKYSEYASLYYPLKSNADYIVVQTLDPYIAGYEVAAFAHIKLLMETHGVVPSRILYSALIKSKREIKEAIKLGVSRFVVDKLEDVKTICELSNCTIEFIVRLDVADFIKTDYVLKWGASLNCSLEIIENILRRHHCFKGVSFYLPQEICNLKNFQTMVELISNYYSKFGFEVLDIGGGVTHQMVAEIGRTIKHYLNMDNTNIWIEPGKYLLDPNISMSVNIIDIRERGGNKLLFIDSGIYSGLLDAAIKSKKFKIILERKVGTTELSTMYMVCGDSPDIIDVLGEYELPIDLKVGDKLIILDCGAYCSVLKTNFCDNKRVSYYIADS